MKIIPDSPGEDRDLINRIVNSGEEKAFRELYRRYTPRLFQSVWRLLGGADIEAEDVIQETWIRACSNLEKFRYESAFGTWLTGIGLNVARDSLRRHGRNLMVEWDETWDAPVPPPKLAERLDLEQALQLLPDGYRMVLVLHDVEGMKHNDIAALLGIETGTSKSQLHNARKRLRQILSTEEEEYHAGS
ncbi:MAG: sigma-70 family RNA polymerase sigma factor [bacterium]